MVTSDLIALPEASALFPSRPCRVTLIRWAKSGYRGVRLRTVTIGRDRYTSQAMVDQFIREQNAEADLSTESVAAQTRRRRREVATAEAELVEAGI